MAILKRYDNFKGVASRPSDLLRKDEYLSDALNVEMSKRQSIKKRRGTITQATGSGGYGLSNYNGSVGLIGVNTGISDLSTGSWVAKTNSGSNTLSTTNLASFIEDNQRLFIANGVDHLMKYDGLSWYRAGVPNAFYTNFIQGTPNSAAVDPTTYEVKIQFISHDTAGNIIDGRLAETPPDPYTERTMVQGTDTTTETLSLVVPSRFYASLASMATKWAQNTGYVVGDVVMAPDNQIYVAVAIHTSTTGSTALADFLTDYNASRWQLDHNDPCGFSNRFAKVNGNQSAINTVTVDAGHGVVVGDYIFVRQTAGFRQDQFIAEREGRPTILFENWRLVSAVGATTITFGGGKVDFLDDEIISTNLITRFYRREISSGEDFQLFLEWGVDPSVVRQSIVVPVSNFIDGGDAPTQVFRRTTPPKGRYIYEFQGLLFVAGDSSDPNVLYWSDVENQEIFPEGDNSQIIGDNNDGPITGIISSNDYLIIFKERSIHFMSGSIAEGNYRVEKIDTGSVGCMSHHSIVDIDGVVHFLDKHGIFRIVGGARPREVSEEINERLTEDTTGLTFSRAVAVHDDKRQQYKLCIPAFTGSVSNGNTRIFVYDYLYGGWWFHASIDYSGGAAFFNDTLYFTVDDVAITTKREQSTLADDGAAISAYARTHWFTPAGPSVPCKWIMAKVYALEGAIYNCRVRSEKDWLAGSYDTDFTLAFTSTQRFDANNIVGEHQRALRLSVENTTVNQDLEVTGIEIEYQTPYVEKIKR